MKKVIFYKHGLTALMMAFAMTMCYSCSSDDEDVTDENKSENSKQFVDLGLSVKWATCNIGATKPEEYGDYFAWGETEPHYIGNPLSPSGWKSDKYESEWYSFACYKYCDAETEYITKYCVHKSDGHKGFTDGKTVLMMEDDAAHVNWGGDWRMPTREEMKELITECAWEYTTLNGVKGYKVRSKKTGYTDNWIFLPEAGGYDYQSFQTGIGGYWSASLDTNESDWAYSICFRGTMKGGAGSCRCIGMSVRPVVGTGNEEPETGKEVIQPSKVDGQVNGHDYVVLAGIMWATENVGKVNGVEASGTDETYGYYYTQANAEKAAASWGGNWTLPTREQWKKLIDECEWTWKEDCIFGGKTINGYIVSEKKDSSKYIFLPAAGEIQGGVHNLLGSHGIYRSSSPYGVEYSYFLFFLSSQQAMPANGRHDFGYSVRMVYAETKEEEEEEEDVNPTPKVDGQINGHDYVELAGIK